MSSNWTCTHGWIYTGTELARKLCKVDHLYEEDDVFPSAQPRPKRLSRPELFMGIAKMFGQRSSCPRANVGAVAVIDGRIVATGYVGAPRGMAHCDEIGCDMEAGHCVRTIHAEANLVAWAARTGTTLRGAEVYSTHSPCRRCAQQLANSGIKSLAYDEIYNEADLQYLRNLGVRVAHWELVNELRS